jgi:signal transduction histidine kinase
VDDAVAGARRLPQARGASIDVHVDDDLPAVEADRGAVVRAVQNLVENALKYGQPTGGGAQGGVAADDAGEAPGGRAPAWVGVRVTANGRAELRDAAGSHAAQAAGRECVVIEVSDRGPGIDAGERRRIFEPFVRGRAAASTRVPGNGLGLSIVRRVAEGHGGRVDVSSHAGGGATFRIELRA